MRCSGRAFAPRKGPERDRKAQCFPGGMEAGFVPAVSLPVLKCSPGGTEARGRGSFLACFSQLTHRGPCSPLWPPTSCSPQSPGEAQGLAGLWGTLSPHLQMPGQQGGHVLPGAPPTPTLGLCVWTRPRLKLRGDRQEAPRWEHRTRWQSLSLSLSPKAGAQVESRGPVSA